MLHARLAVLCCAILSDLGYFAAASHGKAGVTVNPMEADKNQQNTLPHLRLMEWVWSYFVDQPPRPGMSTACDSHQSTKAGSMHAQPSKQLGSKHWQHQEDHKERLLKQQKTGDQHQDRTGGSGSSYEASSSSSVTRSGDFFCLGLLTSLHLPATPSRCK